MNNVKVTAKIYNLDKPTRNGRLYTKDALNRAFNNEAFVDMNEHNAIPIMTEEGHIVGAAHCSLDYPTIDIEGVINSNFKDVLKDAVLTHSGCGYVDCSMEVVKE